MDNQNAMQSGAAINRRDADASLARIEAMHRAVWTQTPSAVPVKETAVHYSELTDFPRASPLYHEWKTYRREVSRLLAEGHEGKFVLVKEERILGLFASFADAVQAGRDRFLLQPFLVQPIRTCEPLLHLGNQPPPCRN